MFFLCKIFFRLYLHNTGMLLISLTCFQRLHGSARVFSIKDFFLWQWVMTRFKRKSQGIASFSFITSTYTRDYAMFDLVRAPGFPQFLQLFFSRSIIRKLSKESLYVFLFFSLLECLDKKKDSTIKILYPRNYILANNDNDNSMCLLSGAKSMV